MLTAQKNTKHHSQPSHQKKKANSSMFIQPKLNIGKAGDKYEQEADRAADQIVSKSRENTNTFISPSTQSLQTKKDNDTQPFFGKPVVNKITPAIQLKSAFSGEPNKDFSIQRKEEELQTKSQDEEVQTKLQNENVGTQSAVKPKEPIEVATSKNTTADTPKIQKQAEEDIQTKGEEEVQAKEEENVQMYTVQALGDTNPSNLENSLASGKGGGSPLPSDTKSEMESGFGADFSGVRVHNDSNAIQMNQELGSQAFTNGNDIYFNEGKYETNSDSGKHLLAHELTHTVQQGSSSNTIQRAEAPQATEVGAPKTVVDVTNGLNLSKDWLEYIASQKKTKHHTVQVKIGSQYSGAIIIKQKGTPKEGEKQQFELPNASKGRYLESTGLIFLNPLRAKGFTPVLMLNQLGEDQKITGYLSFKTGENKVSKSKDELLKVFNSKEGKQAMKLFGLGDIKSKLPENNFENGKLLFKTQDLSVSVDGFIQASGNIGIANDQLTFELNSTISVGGLAEGQFNLKRGEDGNLSGKASIGANIANVNANLSVEYEKGTVTIEGTGKVNSEKFSGELTLLVTDKAKSDSMMDAALGVENMDKAKEDAKPKASKPPVEALAKTTKNQVLAGWGTVDATITPWLKGTAKIGVDSEGQVSIVGKVEVPDEVKLMEQMGKKEDLFNVEIRAGYGIPLVGQAFLFASIGMFANAGFGPLVLKNVAFEGKYSTDPKKLQDFTITGTLGINAFVILGLKAEAGVGLTIIGHDVKAGVSLTAAAGLKAYAEATPTFEYKEARNPKGGKVGESRLKGHFEAAAQLFLQLAGSLFYELDSPWWSPAPDGREDFPLGEVQYPIGDSMGIGADIDWLVGGEKPPELKFAPVEFDPDKFTADVMAEPPAKKKGKSDANPKGKFENKGGSSDKTKNPKATGNGKGLPPNNKKKEDLKKLPDEKKYMRGLDELSKLEKKNPKPVLSVVEAKMKKVKAKYGLKTVKIKSKKDGEVSVFVAHGKQDNGKRLLKIPLMSLKEAIKLRHAAITDLRVREGKEVDPKTSTMEEAKAKAMIQAWLKVHPVVETAKVVDGKTTWDYFIDFGDKTGTEKGKPKIGDKDAKSTLGKEVKFKSESGNHRLWITVVNKKAILMMASQKKRVKDQDVAQGDSQEAVQLTLFADDIEKRGTEIIEKEENGLIDQVEKEKLDNPLEEKQDEIPDLVDKIEKDNSIEGDNKEYFKAVVETEVVKPKKQSEPKLKDPDTEKKFPIHSDGSDKKGTWSKKNVTSALEKKDFHIKDKKPIPKGTLDGKYSNLFKAMVTAKLISKVTDKDPAKPKSGVYTVVSGGVGYKAVVQKIGGKVADPVKELRIALKFGTLAGLKLNDIKAFLTNKVVISADEYTNLLEGDPAEIEAIKLNTNELRSSHVRTMRGKIRDALVKANPTIAKLRTNVLDNRNLDHPQLYQKMRGSIFEEWVVEAYKSLDYSKDKVPYIPGDKSQKVSPDGYIDGTTTLLEMKAGDSFPGPNDKKEMDNYNNYLGKTEWVKAGDSDTLLTFDTVRYVMEKENKYKKWAPTFRKKKVDSSKFEIYHLGKSQKSTGQEWLKTKDNSKETETE